jgi:hypothetical protein
MKRYIYGLSYGATIRSLCNLGEIERSNIDLLEIPLCDPYELTELVQFSERNNLMLGLHIPSYYLIRKHPFVLDFAVSEQVTKYLDSVQAFLEKFSAFEYLVAHLPIHSSSPDDEQKLLLNCQYIDRLKSICMKYGIRLLIENTVIYDCLHSPQDYSKFLDSCGLCFDIGHAHTLTTVLREVEQRDYVSAFLSQCEKSIESVHLYNVSAYNTYNFSTKRHYPFLRDNFQVEDGFMDYESISSALNELSNLKYIIFEPHREEYLFFGGKIGDEI